VGQLTTQPEHDTRAIERAKQQVRERIWALLERENAAKPPGRVVGKIPNFLGAEAAAEQFAALPAWQAAHVVKANPTRPNAPSAPEHSQKARCSRWRCCAWPTSCRSIGWTQSTLGVSA
jgi:hypothetical protein